MTTMDSDSASQDSDNGRRFRFEATRKDSAISADTSNNITKSSKKKSDNKFQYENSKHYRDKKERSKNESNRKMYYKDFRYSIKHSKHELKSLHENYRDSRDASIGYTSNDRESKNFSSDDAWERSRDLKWQTDKNRSIYQSQRESSYDRNYQDDRHKSRCHERYKYRSRNKNRNRSHQSDRVKSSNDNLSRDDYGSKNQDSRKISIKENKSQNLRDHLSPKNVEQTYNHNNVYPSNNLKRKLSIERDIQDCKQLDLSQLDILSETDKNAYDNRNSTNQISPCSPKIKLKRYDSKNQFENSTKQMRENDDEINKIGWEELSEIKRKNDKSDSNSNNFNTISESSFATVSAMLPITKEIHKNSEKEKSRYCEQKTMIVCDEFTTGEYSSLEEKYSHENLKERYLDVSLNDTYLLENDTKRNELTYSPFLSLEFVSDTSNSDKFERTNRFHETVLDENEINKNDKKTPFIGPCLPFRLNEEKEEINVVKNITSATKVNITFGPALPPHLLRQQCKNDSRNKIIGPILPTTTKLCEKNSETSSESDNDCAIGPLPADHPALKNNRVYESLNLRAEKIRNEKCLKMTDVGNQREEWMTDLPSIQTTLGLGPRKFKFRNGPDISDRSCWTDTPMQKIQKQKHLEAKICNNTIESNTKYMKEFLKKESDKSKEREKSLLEMHQEELSKRKKNKGETKQTGTSTRRPFDRNTDLQIHFNQVQKKTILIKAQLLDDRFSHGQI